MRVLAFSAAVAALGFAAVPAMTSTALADDWYGSHLVQRCNSDGDRCATFRCDADGDECTRVSAWSYRGYQRSYRYPSEYGYRYGYPGYNTGYTTTRTRCDAYGDNCETLRCDADGDNCRVISSY